MASPYHAFLLNLQLLGQMIFVFCKDKKSFLWCWLHPKLVHKYYIITALSSSCSHSSTFFTFLSPRLTLLLFFPDTINLHVTSQISSFSSSFLLNSPIISLQTMCSFWGWFLFLSPSPKVFLHPFLCPHPSQASACPVLAAEVGKTPLVALATTTRWHCLRAGCHLSKSSRRWRPSLKSNVIVTLCF